MKQGEIKRKTAETDIELSLNLDGGACSIDTGVGFFDHMLTLFAGHSGFGLIVKCVGDSFVDDHHSVEDVGICLGLAFREALSDMRGITRYGSIILPMDEVLVLCSVDVSGRSCLCFDLPVSAKKIGTYDAELTKEFFEAFTRSAGITLHLKKLYGENSHHIVEAGFKAFSRSLAAAVKIDPDKKTQIPSTKGVL